MIHTFDELIKQQTALDGDFLIEPETGSKISYSEIDTLTSQLAEKLSAAGLKKGDRVALAIRTGINACLSVLAIFRAGGILVPVNLGLKGSEFEYIIEDSQASLLISTEAVLSECVIEPRQIGAEQIADIGGALLYRLSPEKRDNLREDTALILYTSGTTGKPKGVMLTQQNLLAETEYISRGHELTRKDTAMLVLPLFHINGLVIGFLTPFYKGITLVIPRKFSASGFWDTARKYGVKWVSAVPTIISMIMARTTDDSVGKGVLRFMRSASAPLPKAVLDEFEQRFDTPIIESFGISEGASQITSNPVSGIRKPGSAGKPVGNIMMVADEKGRPIPDGEIGEIAVKGENIFYGYFNKPKETAASLRGVWFFTGDLGYRDSDGYYFLKGRKKELINRAGEKFSPREIDEVLYRIEGVELAAAVGVPDPLYNEEVVAYIKLRDGAALSEQQVIDFCKGKIADFKIPKKVFFTDDLPKGPSGKIQRLKLIDIYLRGQK
ncbi:MAG: AMP-binding protein [Oscillospiraceae bacterium]